MKNIVLITDKGTEFFETMKDLFQSMSEDGIIVTAVENGKIITKDGEFEYGYLSIEGTADQFKEEVSGYRDELRSSVALLKKQGIGVSKTELNKLAKQFEFLNEGTSTKKEEPAKENPTKKEVTKEDPEDEIPV